MFNYGRANYGRDIIRYITSKITPPDSFDLNDPFSVEKVVFPLSTPVKGKKFFLLVRENEMLKDSIRNS